MGQIDLKAGQHPADGDAPVCKLLVEDYNPKTGARSLQQKLEQSVKMPLTEAFLQGDEIDEDEVNNGPRIGYSIDHCSAGNQGQNLSPSSAIVICAGRPGVFVCSSSVDLNHELLTQLIQGNHTAIIIPKMSISYM